MYAYGLISVNLSCVFRSAGMFLVIKASLLASHLNVEKSTNTARLMLVSAAFSSSTGQFSRALEVTSDS